MKKIIKLLQHNVNAVVRNSDVRAIVAIIMVVLLANTVYIFVTNQNPLLQRSGLPLTTSGENIFPGQNTLDPNDGFTSQALGVAAARQLISGNMPWWNHYEGVGVPLAGGMQSAALFPYTLLLLLPGGSLIFHVTLEITAAIGMYLLLKKLRLSRKVALFGGILFGLNGTFSWLTNAAFNPIAFLPWMVLGVEMVRGKRGLNAIRGVLITAFALALSLYAGFPETAFINGILLAVWSLVRLRGLDKQSAKTYLIALLGSAVLGVTLAAPVLVAFVGYLPIAYTGGHSSGGFSGVGIVKAGIASLFLPYIYGSINTFTAYDTTNTLMYLWGNVGGYLGMGVVTLAAVGISRKDKLFGLKVALLIWAIIAIARIFATPVITWLVDLIPGIGISAVFRYVTPSVSFALIILAAMGLQKICDRRVSSASWRCAALVSTCLIIMSIGVYMTHGPILLSGAPHWRMWLVGSIAMASSVVGIVLVSARYKMRLAYLAAGVIVVFESLLLFLIPQLSAPLRPASVDTAAVRFLQTNLGMNRFYTLGPIAPNYGSYFKIASINNNDLPIPLVWANYIEKSLNDNTEPILFIGSFQTDPSKGSPQDEFFENLQAYSASGVKYLVAGSEGVDKSEAARHGLKEVYDDSKIEIYQLAKVQPYITIEGECTYSIPSRDVIKTNCLSKASLLRLELYFPGWTVTVNDKNATIFKENIFQKVNVPAGDSTIRFVYAPAYIEVGYALFATAVVTVFVLVVMTAVNRRSGRGRARISIRRKE